MHEFQGDLLIGGMRLKHIHGELEAEDHQPGTHEWRLAGQLHLTPEQSAQLETDRQYRLLLEDGRCATVVLSHIGPDERTAPEKTDALLVDFQPPHPADSPKPR